MNEIMSMSIDDIIIKIELLRKQAGNQNLSTSELLKLVQHFRLDWGGNSSGFSLNYDFGVTKPIILSGLANKENKLKTYKQLFQNSSITKLLTDVFFIEKKLSKDLLLQINNQIIINGGEWRKEDVEIGEKAKIFHPPFSNPENIETEITELVDWYNEEVKLEKLHPIFLSSIFHYKLVRIHPFIDGNGRLARIISSLILLNYSIPPPITEPSDRVEYLTCLRNGDTGDFKPLISFIGVRVISSLEYVLVLKNSIDA